MLSLFFSYSHVDEKYRDELEIHLAMLKRERVISVWHDRRITAGEDIDDKIDANLENADIILLMVSPHFLASDYCYEKEMSLAIEKHNSGKAVVIPVIVHPCDWHNSAFGNLRATPTDGKPISKFPNIHDAYLCVVQDLRLAAERLSQGGESLSPQVEGAYEDQSLPANPRSSNLRMKKEFTDKEKDDFLESTFEYIANFFENSLNELQVRNPQIESRFNRLDKVRFTASVYINGRKTSACKIWLPGSNSFAGEIGYSNNDSGGENSFNESLSIVDDGYSLFLRPMGLALSFSSGSEHLTQQGGAEHLWGIFVKPLQ